jgi:peptidoglycan-N-acetylglucosamine deacetylase
VNPFLISVPAAIGATAGFAAYGALNPKAQLFGHTVCRTDSPKQLAITFDDGPNPAITPKLLDLLDRYNAKATFFLIGQFAQQCPDLVRETVARGHVVGNHSHTHRNLFWLSALHIREELRRCHDAIVQIAGQAPRWFRPPFGRRNHLVIPTAESLQYRTLMWTLIPGDWRAEPADWLVLRMRPIVEHAGDPRRTTGDVICLHDGSHRFLNADRSATLTALEECLPRWRDLGLEFVTIDAAVR